MALNADTETLERVPDAHHGGPEYSRLFEAGIDPADLLDFSVSVNPLPMPDPVVNAFRESNITVYPDSKGLKLTGAIAGYYDLGENEVIPVNGLSQGIWLLSCLLNEKGGTSVIIGPTYGEYEKYSKIAGADVRSLDSREEDGFQPDIDQICGTIGELRPSTVWLCNPDNPTGILMEKEELEEIAKACTLADGRLIIDEAYMNFLPPKERTTVKGDNVIIMRSMTKDFSLPGLRLGYLIGNRKIMEALRKIQPEWSLNTPAISAGAAVFRCMDIYENQWEELRGIKDDFAVCLENSGYEIVKGRANFLLLKHRMPGESSRLKVKEMLWDSGILVRDCTSFGLPDYIRLGVLTTEKNIKLVKELRRLKLWEK